MRLLCLLFLIAAPRAIKPPGATIEVALPDEPFEVPETALLDWLTISAKGVASIFGKFPVSRATIELAPRTGHGIGGTTYPSHEIDIRLGRAVTLEDLAQDWVATHEMVHLGFPSLARQHHWMEEGLATYVEPLARARRGGMTDAQVWGDLTSGMPKGMPDEDDRGLDFTHTWGRTYWGGAIFWLLADVEIRERTHNAKGLPEALRGIVAAGGTIDASWTVEKVAEVGDRATGVPVLRELYEKMKDKASPADLDDLWKRLGVAGRGGEVTFDEKAPLAAIRRAITRPE
jgi:hypothetical protein